MTTYDDIYNMYLPELFDPRSPQYFNSSALKDKVAFCRPVLAIQSKISQNIQHVLQYDSVLYF